MNWLFEVRERPVFFRNNELQIHADESRLIKSDEDNSLLIFRSILFEFVVRYRTHTCPGISKNKPQINADERRLIKSAEENSLLIFRNILLEFFENVKLLRGSDRRRLIKSDDDPCLSIMNSILSRHLFNRTYSSHNYCN